MNAAGFQTFPPAVHAEWGDQADQYQLERIRLVNASYCELDYCGRCRHVAKEVCGQAACQWRSCLVEERKGAGLSWGLVALTCDQNGEISCGEIPLLIFGECNDRRRSELTELLINDKFEEALRFAKKVGLGHRALLLSASIVEIHKGPFEGYTDCQWAKWLKELVRREKEMAAMTRRKLVSQNMQRFGKKKGQPLRRFEEALHVGSKEGLGQHALLLSSSVVERHKGPIKEYIDCHIQGMYSNTPKTYVNLKSREMPFDDWGPECKDLGDWRQHLSMIPVHSCHYRHRQESIPRRIDILVQWSPCWVLHSNVKLASGLMAAEEAALEDIKGYSRRREADRDRLRQLLKQPSEMTLWKLELQRGWQLDDWMDLRKELKELRTRQYITIVKKEMLNNELEREMEIRRICESWYFLLDIAPAVQKKREETWFMEITEKLQASLVPVDNPDTADPDQVAHSSSDNVAIDGAGQTMTTKQLKELRKAKMKQQKEADKATNKAPEEAEKAAKEAQMEAEKAAKVAQEEAEKAAKVAEKDGEKAAKEPEMAAKAAEEEAEKVAKKAQEQEQEADKVGKKAQQEVKKAAKKAQQEVKKAAKKAQQEAKKAAEEAEKAAKAAEKQAEKAQKEAEKAAKMADKAAKKAHKEAEKAAKKAQKYAEKEAEKAAKVAEKEAKKAEKEAERAAKKAEKEAKKAEKEAKKAAKVAQKEAETAGKEAERAAKKAEKEAKKAAKVAQKDAETAAKQTEKAAKKAQEEERKSA